MCSVALFSVPLLKGWASNLEGLASSKKLGVRVRWCKSRAMNAVFV